MLNNLLTLALLLCLAALAKASAQRLAWLFFGVGLAHHYMSQLVLLPAYAGLVLMQARKQQQPKTFLYNFFKKSWLLLPGLSTYLYLPLRASHSPAINWGSISSFGDFFFFLSRRQYSSSELARSASIIFSQASAALSFVGREGHWLGLLLALLAIALLWRKKDPERVFFTVGLVFPYLAAVLYFNLSKDRYYIMEEHLFPTYLFQAILAGQGLWQLSLFLRPVWCNLSYTVLAAVLLASAAFQYPQIEKSQYFYAADSARNLLLLAPSRSVLFSTGDSIIFPLWYWQKVKGLRPDVTVIGEPLLPMPWVRQQLAKEAPDLRQPPVQGLLGTEATPYLVHALIDLNLGTRPLYTTYNQAGPGLQGYQLLPRAMLYQIAHPGDMDNPQEVRQLFKALNQRGLFEVCLDSRTVSLIIFDAAVHHNSLGLQLEEQKQFPAALEEYKLASRLAPQDEEFPFNAGNVLYQIGQFQQATAYYLSSLQRNPTYSNSWYNLAMTYLALRQNEQYRACLEKVLALDPSRQDVRSLLGR